MQLIFVGADKQTTQGEGTARTPTRAATPATPPDLAGRRLVPPAPALLRGRWRRPSTPTSAPRIWTATAGSAARRPSPSSRAPACPSPSSRRWSSDLLSLLPSAAPLLPRRSVQSSHPPCGSNRRVPGRCGLVARSEFRAPLGYGSRDSGSRVAHFGLWMDVAVSHYFPRNQP